MTDIVSYTETHLIAPPASGLESAVGNTPLPPLRRLTAGLPPGVRVLAKAEWFNPSGSVKDRAALSILRAALDAGDLSGGRRLLDSTSGNMGIAYATLGAAFGVPVTLTLPANASPERIAILRALRAELIRLTPQGQEIRRIVDALYHKHVKTVEQVGGISGEEFSTLNKSLHRLERFWTDQILYRL